MPALELPAIGLGTAWIDDPELIVEALDIGYRFVDTAQKYENEAAVGEGIARSDVPREEIVLATKVRTDNLAYDDVLATTRESLDRLGMDAVDLLYVHAPYDAYDPDGTLRAFDELVEAGLTRHVGVSNFTPALLDRARAILDAPIVANQVEVHPLLPQRELLADAREHDMHLIAFAPLIRGEVFEAPELASIAEARDATPAQVSIAWLIQRGVIPIPGAETAGHLRENYGALDVELTPADVERVDGIDREQVFYDGIREQVRERWGEDGRFGR